MVGCCICFTNKEVAMKTVLSIREDKFLINGALVYAEIKNCPEKYQGLLMNSRMIQGVFDDKEDVARFDRYGKKFDPDTNTDELIEALPDWYAKGLRAITVGFQGGGPCFSIDNYTIQNNPFSSDGKSIDPAYLARMKRLILAADEIGMIVIVSYLYGAQSRFIKDDLSIINAVKTASNWLRDEGFTNVIIEIANEHDVPQFQCHPIVYTDDGVAGLIEIAKRESGGLPVGSSGMGTNFDPKIAAASDIIFIHGNGKTRQRYLEYVEKHKAVNNPKRPILCNEDSQAISNLVTSMREGVSWGYYNNMTKQEPPVYWGITKGEDEFYALRMAMELGIDVEVPKLEDQFYLQGFEAHMTYDNKRWIRLASLYPEKIDYVEFYRNGKLYIRAYDDPFSINYIWNWLQGPVTDIKENEEWYAKVVLTDGTEIIKQMVK